MVDGLDASLETGMKEHCWVRVRLVKRFKNRCKISGLLDRTVSNLFAWGGTCRTIPVLETGDQDLFGIIPHKSSEDGNGIPLPLEFKGQMADVSG